HDLLDGYGALASRLQRLCGLVTAASTDLHELIGVAPRGLRHPQLRERGFEANVVALLIRKRTRQLDHGLHREGRARHVSAELRDRLVLADRPAPLNPF